MKYNIKPINVTWIIKKMIRETLRSLVFDDRYKNIIIINDSVPLVNIHDILVEYGYMIDIPDISDEITYGENIIRALINEI